MLNVLRSFCEGTAIGGVGCIVCKKYDEGINDLPLPVRVIFTVLIFTGVTSIGVRAIDHFSKEEK